METVIHDLLYSVLMHRGAGKEEVGSWVVDHLAVCLPTMHQVRPSSPVRCQTRRDSDSAFPQSQHLGGR